MAEDKADRLGNAYGRAIEASVDCAIPASSEPVPEATDFDLDLPGQHVDVDGGRLDEGQLVDEDVADLLRRWDLGVVDPDEPGIDRHDRHLERAVAVQIGHNHGLDPEAQKQRPRHRARGRVDGHQPAVRGPEDVLVAAVSVDVGGGHGGDG